MKLGLFACLLLLVPVIRANIDVKIVAADNEGESSVTVTGTNKGIISDTERITFGLSDSQLKDAVEKSFGKRPDDAFLKSPTPWGDLYLTYGWDQVVTTLTPLSGRILALESQPTIVMTQYFNNNSSHTAEFSAKISQQVENTITSSWTSGGEVTVGQEINYGVNFEVASVGGSTSFAYTSSWGQGVEKSETVTVGSESGITITLEPGQKVVAELYATRGTMKVQVEYEATIAGMTALNYVREYQDHHFWALDIGEVMSENHIPNSSKSSEIIDIGYYTDSTVIVRDVETMKIIYSFPTKVIKY
jgi:hypothetical protein